MREFPDRGQQLCPDQILKMVFLTQQFHPMTKSPEESPQCPLENSHGRAEHHSTSGAR